MNTHDQLYPLRIPEDLLGDAEVRRAFRAFRSEAHKASAPPQPVQGKLPSGRDVLAALLPTAAEVPSSGRCDATSGQRLRLARLAAGLKLLAIAGVIQEVRNGKPPNHPQQRVSQIEHGKGSIPAKKVGAAARLVRVPGAWLQTRGPFGWWLRMRDKPQPAPFGSPNDLEAVGLPSWAYPWVQWIRDGYYETPRKLVFHLVDWYPVVQGDRLLMRYYNQQDADDPAAPSSASIRSNVVAFSGPRPPPGKRRR